MALTRILPLALLSVLAACATSPPPAPAGLAMPAPHEARAASLLAGYLLARGWTVRLADETRVEATSGEQSLRLEPLLDATGIDRIVVTRTWQAVPQATEEALDAFALELNETLNVGHFRVTPAGLALQSSLYFLEVLEPALLGAHLDFTATVRFAVLRVQGERALLAPLEGESATR